MEPLKLQSNVFGPVIQEYRVWSAASLLRPPWTTRSFSAIAEHEQGTDLICFPVMCH